MSDARSAAASPPTFLMLASACVGAMVASVACVVLLDGRRRRRQGSFTLPSVSSRVIFLDLDGVLNSQREGKYLKIEQDKVLLLKRAIETAEYGSDGEDEVSVVLSTFWRPFYPYVTYLLSRHGIHSSRVRGES